MNLSSAPRPARVMPMSLFQIGFRALAGFALLAVAAGCAHKPKAIDIDPRFSMNVAKTPAGFPDKQLKLTAAESELIDRHGPPDFIRIWWRPDGSLIHSSDLSGKTDQLPQTLSQARKSWIYTAEDKEYVFGNNGGYKEQKLDEVIKLVCTYGDPSSRTPPVLRDDGSMHETWIWVEYGIKIELADGHEIDRTHFPASGAGTYLGK